MGRTQYKDSGEGLPSLVVTSFGASCPRKALLDVNSITSDQSAVEVTTLVEPVPGQTRLEDYSASADRRLCWSKTITSDRLLSWLLPLWSTHSFMWISCLVSRQWTDLQKVDLSGSLPSGREKDCRHELSLVLFTMLWIISLSLSLPPPTPGFLCLLSKRAGGCPWVHPAFPFKSSLIQRQHRFYQRSHYDGTPPHPAPIHGLQHVPCLSVPSLILAQT